MLYLLTPLDKASQFRYLVLPDTWQAIKAYWLRCGA